MTDLFLKESKKDMIRKWAMNREYTRTSDAIAWGSANFYNRALRTMQELAEVGDIRRLTDKELEIGCFPKGQGVWTNKI